MQDFTHMYVRRAKKINNSVCYLDSKKGKTNFDSKWNVCYPSYLGQILAKGVTDAEI